MRCELLLMPYSRSALYEVVVNRIQLTKPIGKLCYWLSPLFLHMENSSETSNDTTLLLTTIPSNLFRDKLKFEEFLRISFHLSQTIYEFIFLIV